MSTVTPNGLEHFLLGKWEPCKKHKYSEAGARITLSKMKYARKKFKQHKKRKEMRSYLCKECQSWHLTSIK